MIQRKQTIFLLLAMACLIACQCLPIGAIEPKGMGAVPVLFNYGLYADRAFNAQPIPFVDLVVAGALAFITIFLYKNRRLQMRLCWVNIILLLAWYGYYAFCMFAKFNALGTFHPRFAACLPFIGIVLIVLAHRGIKADEELVRSMDRIR